MRVSKLKMIRNDSERSKEPKPFWNWSWNCFYQNSTKIGLDLEIQNSTFQTFYYCFIPRSTVGLNRWQWCWWNRDVSDLKIVTILGCWWQSFDLGDTLCMLSPDSNLNRYSVLMTKTAKTVTNIFKLSPANFVSNTR